MYMVCTKSNQIPETCGLVCIRCVGRSFGIRRFRNLCKCALYECGSSYL